MSCASNAALQAFVDDELDSSERQNLEQHLSTCNQCDRKAKSIAGDSRQVRGWMAVLAFDETGAIDAKLAYARYLTQMPGQKPAPSNSLHVWLGVRQISAIASALALILFLSLSPAKTWAQRFLQMLRVQKLAFVPIDSSTLTHVGIADGRTQALAQLISDSVVVTIKPGNPVAVPALSAAAASVTFPVETLDSLGAPAQILVEDQGAFYMTLDADRIRAVLQEAGRSEIQIPSSINGSTIAVQVSKGVSLSYGNCKGAAARYDQTCVHFLQIPSPVVSVPPGLNIRALAEAGLQLAGLSAAEASNFAETVDWSSTLVIPVPQNKAAYRTVPVDGVNATLIEFTPEGPFAEHYDLLWLKNGVIHSVSGLGSSARALAAAANLGS